MILYRREHDATAVQIGKDVDKVFQRTTNAIEFIDNKCVALAEITETFLQHGPLFNSGDLLGKYLLTACLPQCGYLHIKVLLSRRYSCITDITHVCNY